MAFYRVFFYQGYVALTELFKAHVELPMGSYYSFAGLFLLGVSVNSKVHVNHIHYFLVKVQYDLHEIFETHLTY